MSQQEPVGMGADWLDETLTAEIRYQLYSGGSIAVLRFARELRQKHRAFRPDPVGAAMTRDEIIEALRGLVEAVAIEVNEKGAGGYLLARLSDARDALKSLPPSAPPVQAITEAMVEVGALAILRRRGFGFYTDPMEGGQDAYDISCEAVEEARDALEAAFRARPSSSEWYLLGLLSEAKNVIHEAILALPVLHTTLNAAGLAGGDVAGAMLSNAQRVYDKISNGSRPVPSDDAQRVRELEEKLEAAEAIMGDQDAALQDSARLDTLRASNLAEFREQAIKVMEARADYWANNSQAGICQALLVEECNRAIAAIRALPIPQSEAGWRPIETAPPKDGTSIWIINASGYQCQSWWDERFQCWGDPDDPNSPTHWMPLPVPPAKEPK